MASASAPEPKLELETTPEHPPPDLSQVYSFCWQYLQVVEPAPELPDGTLLRQQDVQELLYERLFCPRVLEKGPPPSYALRVLKALMAKVEASIDDWDRYEVSDNLMASLAELASTASLSIGGMAAVDPMKKYPVTYHVSTLARRDGKDPTITLLENRATISAAGTTGIRTWEAALHLSNYLCAHPDLVRGRHVLELGAGTAYVSILCARFLEANRCTATDGSTEVVAAMPANLALNGLKKDVVAPVTLLWGEDDHDEENQTNTKTETEPDLLLGADITFDDREMPSLLQTMRSFVARSPQLTIVVAATERNRKTYDTFLQMAASTFAVTEVPFAVPRREEQPFGPFYSDRVPIHICQLRAL